MFCTSLSITAQPILAKADFESDFELEEEPYHTEPYFFEVEYTEEELRKQEAVRARQAAVQPAVVDYPRIPRTEDTCWCTCCRCVPTASENECLCCRERDLAETFLLEICLAAHPDFQLHIEPAVLSTFF